MANSSVLPELAPLLPHCLKVLLSGHQMMMELSSVRFDVWTITMINHPVVPKGMEIGGAAVVAEVLHYRVVDLVPIIPVATTIMNKHRVDRKVMEIGVEEEEELAVVGVVTETVT